MLNDSAASSSHRARIANEAFPQKPLAHASSCVMRDEPVPVRIIAWGNRGRRDDGVALALAERLENRYASDPRVIVQQYHQLGPELAADLSRTRTAIFIDADVREDSMDVSVEPLSPIMPAGLDTHHCPPAVLLGLTQSLGWSLPAAYLIGVRAHDLGFGDELAAPTRAALDQAEQQVINLVDAALSGGWRHA